MIAPLAALLVAEPEPVGADLFLPTAADLLWSAVVVLIIGVAFFVFILPRMLVILDERTAKIEGGLAKAEEARIAADQTLQMRQVMLDEARADAAKTRDQARAAGEEIVDEYRQNATAEATRINEAAQRQIAAEREAAEAALRADVGTLATDLAAKIVGEQLDTDAAKSRSVDRFLDQLQAQADATAAARAAAPMTVAALPADSADS